MNSERKNRLLAILKENDSKEIPFAVTKKSLLKEGFIETEISHALYESPYDGKKNIVKQESEVTQAYRKNPKLAEKIGKHMLDDAERRERDEAIAFAAAARFGPGRYVQSKYSYNLLSKLGLSFFAIFFGLLIVSLCVYVFKLPVIINTVATLVVGAWVGRTFYIRYIKK